MIAPDQRLQVSLNVTGEKGDANHRKINHGHFDLKQLEAARAALWLWITAEQPMHLSAVNPPCPHPLVCRHNTRSVRFVCFGLGGETQSLL